MYFSFIGYVANKEIKVKPEVIWLIVRMIYQHGGECDSLPLNRSEMMAEHSISTTVYADMIRFFQQWDLLEVNDGKRHLMLSTFLEYFDLSLLNAKANVESGEIRSHRNLLAKILGGNVKDDGYIVKAGTKKSHESSTRLRVSNLLLLVILINYADSCGCVRDVSRGRLRKMMGGISDDRLKSLLNTLLSEGYLLNYVGGATDIHLFGKVEGVFFLNLQRLDRPKFKEEPEFNSVDSNKVNMEWLMPPSRQALRSYLFNFNFKEYPLGLSSRTLRKEHQRFGRPYGCADSKAFLDMDWLKDWYKHRTGELIQLKLEEVASEILSTCWDVLSNLDEIAVDIPSQISEKIQWLFEKKVSGEIVSNQHLKNEKDIYALPLFANKYTRGLSDDESSKETTKITESHEAFKSALSSYSWKLALVVKAMLLAVSENEMNGFRHCIIFPNKVEYLHLEANDKKSKYPSTNHIESHWKVQSTKDENVILTEFKARFKVTRKKTELKFEYRIQHSYKA